MKLRYPGLVFLLACQALLAGPNGAEGYSTQIQVSPLLRTSTNVAGQPIVFPKVDDPEVTAVFVEIPPGAETGWHKHPFPCFAYMLSGQLDVEMEGGKTHRLAKGEAMAESVNVLHNGRNTGSEPARLVMFVMGEKEKPFTERVTHP